MNVSPIGFQLGDLGDHPSGGSLRSWGTRCTVCSSEKLGAGGSLLMVRYYAGSGFYGESVPTCLNAGVFSVTQSVEITQLVSGCLRGNCLMCSCIFGASMGRGKFKSLQC